MKIENVPIRVAIERMAIWGRLTENVFTDYVAMLRAGRPVTYPAYDYADTLIGHTRVTPTDHSDPGNFSPSLVTEETL